MLILLVQNDNSNNADRDDLLGVITSKFPNASVNMITRIEALGMTLDESNPALFLTQDKLLASKLLASKSIEDRLDVILWRDLPDLFTKFDMYLQLQRYKNQYPLHIDGWVLKEVIHSSDEAIVYRAENTQGKQAAVKQFKFLPSMITNKIIDQVLQLVESQCAEKAKRLVNVYEGGVYDQSFYLVMEYLNFGTLRQSLNSCGSPLPLTHTLEWFQEIVLALNCVHKSGLIHRDLKIENILLREDGTLTLTDYGISKRILLAAGFVSEQQLHCSPYYVSPEQLSGDACSQATDIYSLGVILFELLTGRKPYEAKQVHELMMHHVMAPVPVLPEELSSFQPLIDKMMAKNPEDRFSSVLDAIDRLPIAA